MLYRIVFLDSLLYVRPVDFLLRVDAADDVLVCLQHGHDVVRVKADVCVNKEHVGTLFLLHKDVDKRIPSSLYQALVEHKREADIHPFLFQNAWQLQDALCKEPCTHTAVHGSSH